MRPVADGCTPSRPASVARFIGPSLDKMTRVRNCADVMVSSTCAIERAEMATNNRDAVSNASVIKSTESSCAAAFSVGIDTPRPVRSTLRLCRRECSLGTG
jgi:hypothetical protein